MPDVVVDHDPALMTDQDLGAVLAVLEDIAVSGEGAPVRPSRPGGRWTLVLHWQQRGPVSADTEAALPDVLLRVREHFTVNGRTPPARLDVVDQGGGRLLRVDPPDPGGNAAAPQDG